MLIRKGGATLERQERIGSNSFNFTSFLAPSWQQAAVYVRGRRTLHFPCVLSAFAD